MADTIFVLHAPSSGVFTFKAYPAAGGAIINTGGDALVADPNGNAGTWRATVSEAVVGGDFVRVTDASDNTIANYVVKGDAVDDTGEYKCVDMADLSLSTADIASIVAGVQAVSEDVASPLSVNVINVTEGDQWQIVIEGLGTLANNTNLIFMLKHHRSDPDAEAVITVDKTTGLLTVQGTTWATASDATIVVDDESAGDVTITVKSAATKKVKSATYADALKSLRSSANGGDITYRPKGETIVSEGPINTAT